MQRVLETLHEKYVPFSDVPGQERTYSQQGFAADQLSAERGVNCLLQLQNGFTPKEQLEGIHFEIADFHGGMKFLQVSDSGKQFILKLLQLCPGESVELSILF